MHVCVLNCVLVYIYVLIIAKEYINTLENWSLSVLFVWLVIWDGISSNQLHNANAQSCLKWVAPFNSPPPPSCL